MEVGYEVRMSGIAGLMLLRMEAEAVRLWYWEVRPGKII